MVKTTTHAQRTNLLANSRHNFDGFINSHLQLPGEISLKINRLFSETIPHLYIYTGTQTSWPQDLQTSCWPNNNNNNNNTMFRLFTRQYTWPISHSQLFYL